MDDWENWEELDEDKIEEALNKDAQIHADEDAAPVEEAKASVPPPQPPKRQKKAKK